MRLYQYMQYRDFEEDWICPYCKEVLKKFVRIFEEEKNGEIRTSIHVNYGAAPIHDHRASCRNRKLMELSNYHIQELDCCANCDHNCDCDIYNNSEEDGICEEFDRYTSFLGKCDRHKKVDKRLE